jgi:hypothetical protein
VLVGATVRSRDGDSASGLGRLCQSSVDGVNWSLNRITVGTFKYTIRKSVFETD